MAEVTVTTNVEALKVLFNKMAEVYYISQPNTALASLSSFDMEIPVTEDGVTFDTGEPDITKIKLTNGANWATMQKTGDADISFQVPSLAGPINDLFMEKKTQTTLTMSNTVFGDTYEGDGYSNDNKKVTGALFMRSGDRESAIYIPNFEGYASLVASESDKPSYFNLKVTPLNDANGCAYYLLHKKATAGA